MVKAKDLVSIRKWFAEQDPEVASSASATRRLGLTFAAPMPRNTLRRCSSSRTCRSHALSHCARAGQYPELTSRLDLAVSRHDQHPLRPDRGVQVGRRFSPSHPHIMPSQIGHVPFPRTLSTCHRSPHHRSAHLNPPSCHSPISHRMNPLFLLPTHPALPHSTSFPAISLSASRSFSHQACQLFLTANVDFSRASGCKVPATFKAALRIDPLLKGTRLRPVWYCHTACCYCLTRALCEVRHNRRTKWYSPTRAVFTVLA